MFKAILRFLGIMKPEPVVMVPPSLTELARQEIAFEAYLEYLYGLDSAQLFVMKSDALMANNFVRVRFLKKVIDEKQKRVRTKTTTTNRKIVDYPETEPLANQILLMQLYTQQSPDISSEKSDTSSKVEGKGGTFDGAGASGDWERDTLPTQYIINPAPRVYTTGIVDHDRMAPIEPETRGNSRGVAPLNPVYRSTSPEETRHRVDDGFGMTHSSALSKSRSHTPDPDPVYHNPPSTYSPPASYEPPSQSCSSSGDSSSSSSCDSGGSGGSCD